VAVICELQNNSVNCKDESRIGEMMKGEEVTTFSKKYNLPIIQIKDIK